MDHWMLAPPHGFSQLAASFFACPRPGIPRVPLLRLTSSLPSREHRETESGRATSLPHVLATLENRSTVRLRYAYDARRTSRRSQSPELSKSRCGSEPRTRPAGRARLHKVRKPRCGSSPYSRLRGRGFDPRMNRWSGVRAGDSRACFQSLRTYSRLQKGGDPAAGSPTATLLRLRPSHRACLRPLPPCG